MQDSCLLQQQALCSVQTGLFCMPVLEIFAEIATGKHRGRGHPIRQYIVGAPKDIVAAHTGLKLCHQLLIAAAAIYMMCSQVTLIIDAKRAICWCHVSSADANTCGCLFVH